MREPFGTVWAVSQRLFPLWIIHTIASLCHSWADPCISSFRQFLHFSLVFLNQSIVDLQCCVDFCSAVQQSDCYMCAYIYVYICVCVCVCVYTYTFIFFSIMVYLRILSIVPCAIQWTLLFTLSVCNSLPLLTPHSSNLDRLLHLPRCSWSHLVICCITLAVTPVVMHSNLRLCSCIPTIFSTVLYSCPVRGSNLLNMECFRTWSPGNRPWARGLSAYEFLRKCSPQKLITKQGSRIWRVKNKQEFKVR